MDLNLTLLGQMITFAIFVWFTMKYVWPPITKAMQDRQDKIAAGLTAAEQGEKSLEIAREQVNQQLAEAKTQAAQILAQANQRGINLVEEAKSQAREESKKLLQMANDEIEREYNKMRKILFQEVAGLAVIGAEKILGREVDKASNDRLVNELVKEV